MHYPKIFTLINFNNRQFALTHLFFPVFWDEEVHPSMFVDVGYVHWSVGSHCLVAHSSLEPLLKLLPHHRRFNAAGGCQDLEIRTTGCRLVVIGRGEGHQCGHTHCDVLLSTKLSHILQME